ncbi:CU044_5270 family protein [Streptosporangium sp. NPDC000396]|uniref:CU044_5270 family protein n=1 Tax=Streptosporangium sp. NPDC000396 TaxID=3366185 RepID=UPI0036CDDE79
MNEFKLIDTVMPDVPPSDPGKVAEVRTRVLAGGRRRRISAWAGVLVAATATVAVIAGVVLVPRLGGGSATVMNQPAAREVLFGAADRLARRQEAAEKPYWRREIEVVSRDQADPAVGRFVVEIRNRQVVWLGRRQGKVHELRGLSSTPYTSADETVWRRAGSPRLCGVDADCANDSNPMGRTRYLVDPGLKAPLSMINNPLTVDELLRLPEEPGALKAKLQSYWPAYQKAMKNWPTPPPGGSLPDANDHLRELSEVLLYEVPSTSQVRAAAYRILADLPGMRVADGVRTVDGRHGVALTMTVNGGVSERQLVVDRNTGELMAIQEMLLRPDARKWPGISRGTVTHTLVMKNIGWTDDKPAVPKSCLSGKPTECLR